ncbi:MAG TPA: STAS domain-containing protein [Methylocystis sp.]|nr:STAS domain-containing protein [Methylocystis sp.]
MELTTTDIGNDITKISLAGRLDIDGALKIDGPFMDMVKAKKFVAVDLSAVSFLASLGMRTLVSGAKASWANSGKLVLLKPQENVEKVLRAAAIDTIIPIVRDMSEAERVFGL